MQSSSASVGNRDRLSHGAHHTAPHTAGFAHPHKNVAALGIEPGMTVADFGAGSGHYTLAIAEALENSGKVYAIDVQRDLLTRIHNESAKRHLKHVQVVWADLEEPHASKLADHSIDFVLVSNMLFQVHKKRAVLDEARRILRPRGRLAIIDWSDPAGNASRSNGAGSFGPHRDHHVSKVQAMQLAHEARFALIREFEAGAHHYGLLFKHV